MKVNITKEWFASRADAEKGLSVEAGGLPPSPVRHVSRAPRCMICRSKVRRKSGGKIHRSYWEMQDVTEPAHKERIIRQAKGLAEASNGAIQIEDALEIVASTWLLMGPQVDSLANSDYPTNG